MLVHGSGADRRQLATLVPSLVGEGFGVLAIDLPGHGESAGRVTYGRSERDALKAAVDYVGLQPDVDPERIGALGLSVGAAILAVAAAEDPRIRAIVLVSPFADSEEQVRALMAPSGAAAQWAALAVDRHYMTSGPLRPLDAAGALRGRAMLVIGVVDDDVVPLWMSQRLYDAVDTDKELFVLPSGGHANVRVLAEDTCIRRIAAFYQRTLLFTR